MNFHARANKIMDLAWDVVLGWGDVVLGEGWLLSVGVGGQDTQYQTLLIARASDRKSTPNHGGSGTWWRARFLWKKPSCRDAGAYGKHPNAEKSGTWWRARFV